MATLSYSNLRASNKKHLLYRKQEPQLSFKGHRVSITFAGDSGDTRGRRRGWGGLPNEPLFGAKMKISTGHYVATAHS